MTKRGKPVRKDYRAHTTPTVTRRRMKLLGFGLIDADKPCGGHPEDAGSNPAPASNLRSEKCFIG